MTTQPTEPAELTPQTDQTQEQELKVVIVLRAGRGLGGVSSPHCDPQMASLELAEADSLAQALGALPGIVALARERWREQRRYPSYERPAPTIPPVNTRASPTPKRDAPTTNRTATLRPKPGPVVETPRLM